MTGDTESAIPSGLHISEGNGTAIALLAGGRAFLSFAPPGIMQQNFNRVRLSMQKTMIANRLHNKGQKNTHTHNFLA